MLTVHELEKIAHDRLEDAIILHKNGRNEGCAYLCGYSIEAALKATIWKTIRGFPSTNDEIKVLRNLWSHDLDELLNFSGKDTEIKKKYFADWSLISAWQPDKRYKASGAVTTADAENMLGACERLLKVII